MEAFDFEAWWDTVIIADGVANSRVKEWFEDESVTNRDALVGLHKSDFPSWFLIGWKAAIMTATMRLRDPPTGAIYQQILL
jgi:hypothetical protein